MKLNNVIQFERSAEFYFDLGYKYINKGKLKTALRYVEKAAKLKPDDGFILFNYAGLLAELGDIDGSTRVLENIVENVDSSYAECFFGLGCNYLQLQKIKKSIQYFKQYLKADPDGEFSEEAEDLLEMLTMIKDANNNMDDDELADLYKLEEDAIMYLEKREYEKAAECFETVVKALPNAVPARNNLSLTYYYLGHMDKAIELAKEVLYYEPENIHASCNLAIYYNKTKASSWMDKQILEIKKLVTDNPEYIYKIADTLGCLRKHKDAYKYYKRLLSMEADNPIYIHYGAVAAYNSGMYDESIKLWKRLSKINPDNFLSDYHIDKAYMTIENSACFGELLYINQLPKEEVTRRIQEIYAVMEMTKKEFNQHMETNPEIIESVYFGINFDKHLLRSIIYNKIKNERFMLLTIALQKMLLRKDVDDNIKIETIFLLDILNIQKPYKVYMFGSEISVDQEPLSFFELEEKTLWESIKDAAINNMRGRYERYSHSEIQELWYYYLKYSYPELPSLTNINAWAAALEYAYCKRNNIKKTQTEIAKQYNIAVSTLSEKHKNLNNVLEKYR